jgi:hypothetical protein
MRCRSLVSFLVVALFFGAALSLSAQSFSADFGRTASDAGRYGTWQVSAGRLYQRDVVEPLAKINFRVPQSGLMEYTFNVRYEGGGIEDMKAGFGLQVFVDSAHSGRSWGNGKSWLLWLNYDENATYGGKGFRGQVYKSKSHTSMQLMDAYDIELDASVLTEENLDIIVPVKITVDGRNGQVRVWDPTVDNYYYEFYLDDAPGSGNYISFRTNSLSASFDDLRVRKLR